MKADSTYRTLLSLSITQIKLLKLIGQLYQDYTGSQLAKTLGTDKGYISKELKKLIKLELVEEINLGVYKNYRLSKHRKEEIKYLLSLSEKLQQFPVILRGHYFRYASKIISLPYQLKKILLKDNWIVYYPNNRICFMKTFPEGNIRIEVKSRRIYYDLNHVLATDTAWLEFLAFRKAMRLHNYLCKLLYTLNISTPRLLTSATYPHIAILGDNLAIFALKIGYKDFPKNTSIDRSIGIPEYEREGLTSIEDIRYVLALRAFCIKYHLTELKLAKLLTQRGVTFLKYGK